MDTFFPSDFRLRLTQLNEEIGMDEQAHGESDTYTDVMIDFSRIAVSQPDKLQRPKRLSFSIG